MTALLNPKAITQFLNPWKPAGNVLGQEGQKYLASRLYMLAFVKSRQIFFGHRNRSEPREARVLLNTIPHLLESGGGKSLWEMRGCQSMAGLYLLIYSQADQCGRKFGLLTPLSFLSIPGPVTETVKCLQGVSFVVESFK